MRQLLNYNKHRPASTWVAIKISYTNLTAPDTGIITAFNIEAGQVVAAGQSVGTLAAGHDPEAVIAPSRTRNDQDSCR